MATFRFRNEDGDQTTINVVKHTLFDNYISIELLRLPANGGTADYSTLDLTNIEAGAVHRLLNEALQGEVLA